MSSEFSPASKYQVLQPQWSKHAVIYQVNTRQFSEEGNFRGVQSRLADIRELGADIIWLMPVHPIGKKSQR